MKCFSSIIDTTKAFYHQRYLFFKNVPSIEVDYSQRWHHLLQPGHPQVGPTHSLQASQPRALVDRLGPLPIPRHK